MNRTKPGKKKQRGLLHTLCQRTTSTYSGILFITANKESIAFVRETGAKPILIEYSPIPHTPLFEKAKQMSSYDLEKEPLFHNNSILPCQWDGFTLADFRRLKEDLRR
jgi:hypothetical protein